VITSAPNELQGDGVHGGASIKQAIAIPFRCVPLSCHSIGRERSVSGQRSASILSMWVWTVSADLPAGEPTVFRSRQQVDLLKPHG
jgi:hypothetical protein